MTRSRLILTATLALGVGAAAILAYQATSAPPPSLAAFAPSGSLLAIESPNFAALLASWTASPEQQRWLKSDNYAGFSRSRLFDRLGQAQDEFATVAGLSPDVQFAQQVAGSQSLFAWYDIGKLEFLYITRMPPGAAAKSPLLRLTSKFESRKVGPDTFFVRTASSATDATDPYSTARTVAFAVHGDYLLLATREDLLAQSLQLLQHPDPTARTLQTDPFYATSVAAANQPPGDLRMTLNLARLVRSPYFRTYWIQQNVSELKPYAAALSDLYRTPTAFREERVLLSADTDAAAAPTQDLGPILAYLPANSGVYRASALPSTQDVLSQLEGKLLTRGPSDVRDPHQAPTADLSTPTAGDTTELETRIDAPLLLTPTRAAALLPLTTLLDTAHPTAMLAFSTATTAPNPVTDPVFEPIHTAIALTSAAPWQAAAVQQALTAAIAPQLTIAGLTWQPHSNATANWFALAGPHTLAFAIQGTGCLIASDEPTLLRLLAAQKSAGPAGPAAARIATTIAGFDHRSERRPFARLTTLLDHTATPTPPQHPEAPTPGAASADAATADEAADAEGATPPFFSANVQSLSTTFQDLDSETFTATPTNPTTTHQTILYQLHH